MASTERDQPQGNVTPIATAPDPIDPRVRIGHVHLRTADIDRVKGFYVDILGFDVIQQARHYPSRGALGDAIRRLRDADWPLRQVADHGTHLAIYVTDPDGNDVELVWDRSWDEWPRDGDGHVQMAMDGDVDLDALVAESRA